VPVASRSALVMALLDPLQPAVELLGLFETGLPFELERTIASCVAQRASSTPYTPQKPSAAEPPRFASQGWEPPTGAVPFNAQASLASLIA